MKKYIFLILAVGFFSCQESKPKQVEEVDPMTRIFQLQDSSLILLFQLAKGEVLNAVDSNMIGDKRTAFFYEERKLKRLITDDERATVKQRQRQLEIEYWERNEKAINEFKNKNNVTN